MENTLSFIASGISAGQLKCGKTGQITADARISAAILLCLRKVTTRCCISCKSCYTGYRRRKMCEKNVHLPWADVLQGCVAEVVGQIAANRGIAHLFDYCFTTNGTIYSMKSVFNIQEMV